jgi:hypothetical protein
MVGQRLTAWQKLAVRWCVEVSVCAIESILKGMLGSVLESVLRTYLGAYSPAGCECANEWNWERPGEHAQECT